ncbi:hypothetical protein EBU71_17950 [bacterium]|nr:hypothetical protein [Candidatus Elulimicrobium humile]
MYNINIDKNLEEESSKNRIIKVNFGIVYLFLLIFSFAFIYFYSVYQSNYLTILVPYRVLWSVAIIVIGVSMLRIKHTGAFSLAFFITTLSVGITITSIFVYSSNIQDNINTSIIPIKDVKELAFDINFTSTQAKISSEESNIFKGDFSSNYDTLISSNYIDENKVENIKLEQNLWIPGIGSYSKSSDIVFPNLIPVSFKINTDFSSVKYSLSGMKLKSGHIVANRSLIDIKIDPIEIYENTVLDINSNFSRVNIVASKDIPIIISYTSGYSQIEFIGLSKDLNSSNVYRTTYKDITSQEQSKNKQLTIKLTSNFSQIKVIQE